MAWSCLGLNSLLCPSSPLPGPLMTFFNGYEYFLELHTLNHTSLKMCVLGSDLFWSEMIGSGFGELDYSFPTTDKKGLPFSISLPPSFYSRKEHSSHKSVRLQLASNAKKRNSWNLAKPFQFFFGVLQYLCPSHKRLTILSNLQF